MTLQKYPSTWEFPGHTQFLMLTTVTKRLEGSNPKGTKKVEQPRKLECPSLLL